MNVTIPPPDGVVILADGEHCPTLPLVESGGVARAVMWPGVGAHKRSMHRFELGPDASTVVQRHPSEAVYYVISGELVAVDETDGERHGLDAGAMAHISPGTSYRFVAGPSGAHLVGGPCPPDPELYRHLES